MKRMVLLCVLAFGVLQVAPPEADARPRPRRGEAFQSNKTFGIGVMLGVPTAITGKYYLSSNTAIDFGVGAYYYRGQDGFHLHADYLIHPVNLTKTADFWLPLYLGVGGRFFDHDDGDDHSAGSHLGVRLPLGVAMDFTNVPLEVFFEVAFVLDFLIDHGGDSLYADLGPAIGLRYYFE